MNRKLVSILCLLSFIFTALHAIITPSFGNQGKDLPLHYKFNRIDHEEGLMNSRILDITQDSLGYIWIATSDGLYRYDGLHCKAFYHQEKDTNSITNNNVSSLFIDFRRELFM